MAIASDVITKVRQNLVDPIIEGSNPRWSDDRLLSLLNDALHYVVLEGRYNPQQGWVKLVNNQTNYDLSNDIVKLLRVEYNSKQIPFRTLEEMDKLFPNGWTGITGKRPEYIVTGLKAIGHFSVFPLIETVGLNIQVDANQLTGVITELQFSEDDIEIIGIEGDLNSDDILAHLKVIYVEQPTEVTSTDQELDAFVDAHLVTVLPYYITAEAYKDNQDVENLNQSNLFWQGFLQRLFNSSIGQSGNTTDKIRTTGYNGGINA